MQVIAVVAQINTSSESRDSAPKYEQNWYLRHAKAEVQNPVRAWFMALTKSSLGSIRVKLHHVSRSEWASPGSLRRSPCRSVRIGLYVSRP